MYHKNVMFESLGTPDVIIVDTVQQCFLLMKSCNLIMISHVMTYFHLGSVEVAKEGSDELVVSTTYYCSQSTH